MYYVVQLRDSFVILHRMHDPPVVKMPATIKMHTLVRHACDSIRRHGTPKVTSTNPLEHLHVPLKALTQNTNQQISTGLRKTGQPSFMGQFTDKLVFKEQLEQTPAMKALDMESDSEQVSTVY